MTTSTINHRPAVFVAVAATSFVVALLATPTSASATPERDDRPAAAGHNAPTDRHLRTHDHYIERACFIKPPTWNEASDGPPPRCHTYVP